MRRAYPVDDVNVLRVMQCPGGALAHVAWLTPRDLDVLRDLSHRRWMQPMHIGGFSGSHHSQTLAKLAKRGLAEINKTHGISCLFGQEWKGKLVTRCRCKGSRVFRRTAAGTRVIEVRFGVVFDDPVFSHLHGNEGR